MTTRAQAVALAAILSAGKGEPRVEGRRLILWRDVRRILDKYGIRYKHYDCRFQYNRKHVDASMASRDERLYEMYRRRKLKPARVEKGVEIVEYRRVKLVVYDYGVVKKALEILRDPRRARTIFARHFSIVKEVLTSLRSISLDARRYYARWTLRKVFSLFNIYEPGSWRRPYEKYLTHAIVRFILPNWRGSRYKMFLLCKPYMLSSR